MVDFDPANQQSPVKLVVLGGKPTVDELKAAISGSAFSARYPADFLRKATKNDLIYVCRQHSIAVPGLPGV